MLQMRQCEVCPSCSQRGQSKLPSTDGQSVACCFDDIYELKATSDMGCSIVSMCKCYKNCILIVCFVETASLYRVDRWLCILWKLHPCTVWIVWVMKNEIFMPCGWCIFEFVKTSSLCFVSSYFVVLCLSCGNKVSVVCIWVVEIAFFVLFWINFCTVIVYLFWINSNTTKTIYFKSWTEETKEVLS